MQSGDRLVGVNGQAKDTVMQVRKHHAKMNSLDVFDIFRRLPNSF